MNEYEVSADDKGKFIVRQSRLHSLFAWVASSKFLLVIALLVLSVILVVAYRFFPTAKPTKQQPTPNVPVAVQQDIRRFMDDLIEPAATESAPKFRPSSFASTKGNQYYNADWQLASGQTVKATTRYSKAGAQTFKQLIIYPVDGIATLTEANASQYTTQYLSITQPNPFTCTSSEQEYNEATGAGIRKASFTNVLCTATWEDADRQYAVQVMNAEAPTAKGIIYYCEFKTEEDAAQPCYQWQL